MLSMPNTKNSRPFARINRASVTLVAGLGLAAASLALAHDKHEKHDRADRSIVKTDKSVKPTNAVAIPAKGKVTGQRELEPAAKTPAKGRVVIGASKPVPADVVIESPFLKPPQVLSLENENAAFQINPVTGMGMIFSPSGTPLLLQLEPAKETAGWVGQILGEDLSSVLILPTKWGVTAQVQSQTHGAFRMLPDGNGGVELTATNPDNIGLCKLLLSDDENDFMPRSAGMLAGAGECFIDTVDTIDDAPGPPAPQGSSFFVRRIDENCGAAPFVEAGTADLVDETVRTNEINCNNDPGTTNPPFDMIVDVLVGYSGDTLLAAGSLDVILAASALDFAYMNLCLFNSEMRFRVRCVGVEAGIGYAEDGTPGLYVGSGNPERDLDFLKNSTDFYRRGLENIMIDLRDERGADLVCCYVANNNTSTGGIAGPLPGMANGGEYSANPFNPAAILTWGGAGGGTFAHEMGHLLGAQHANEASTIEGTDNEDCPTDETFGTPYSNIDEQEGFSLACADVAAAGCTSPAPTPNYPLEYNWGYRNWIDEAENLGFRTVMAYEADDITLISIPFYANPEVPIFDVATDGNVGAVSCICCEQGGETAANGLVMQENALNTVSGLPSFTDEGTGGLGTEHWPSTFGTYPPNFGAQRYTNPLDPYHFEFPNRAGVAQYRCRKIPYDCNQNGYLDTLEFDGVAPNANADGLTDVDNDRVPDGCFPRECFEAKTLDPFDDEAALAITTFVPESSEDLGDPDRLFGNGGSIPDNGLYESDLRQTPIRNFDNDLYLAYEPTELRIDGMVHPQFTDLTIDLVREDIYGEETVWSVLDCTGLQGQSGASSTLAGSYVFTLSGRPETIEEYPAATTLSARELCSVASSGEYGNLIPGGVYRPSSDLIEFDSTAFNDRWFLRFTDLNTGAAGFFSGWSMKMKVLPYSEDCNSDGAPDSCFDAFEFDTDCNLNGLADSCEISTDALSDCDLNGVLDDCEDTAFLLDLGGPIWDADESGDIQAAPLGGFAPDVVYIRDVLGCADFVDADSNSCIPNCRPDLCDFIADPALDFNQNFIIDCAEGPSAQCSARLFDSAARGLTGEGGELSDLTILNSTIVVPVEEDAGLNLAVLEDATVLGTIFVRIRDLEHLRPSDLQISLVHESDSGLRVTDLLLFGCDGGGYFAQSDTGTTYAFSGSGVDTLCEASEQGGVIPEGDTVFYLPVSGSFSTHIGAEAAGSWTLQIFDGVFDEPGSFSGWDLQFVHRPPDANNNGTPDICEQP
jgi:hypothetical protein